MRWRLLWTEVQWDKTWRSRDAAIDKIKGTTQSSNIRSNFSVRHLEYLVAKAARTFRMEKFYNIFNEIKNMDPACAKALGEIAFPGKCYNIMISNLAEFWNSLLPEARI
ncbi:hypothetical protein HID58_048037, partial [Brassica napus]